jgi:hypothetical protein
MGMFTKCHTESHSVLRTATGDGCAAINFMEKETVLSGDCEDHPANKRQH